MLVNPENALSVSRTTLPTPLVESRFIPMRYEPNYAYPLLVFFHGRGGDEQQMLHWMPSLSRRNHVGLSFRAPEALLKNGQPRGFSWSNLLPHACSRSLTSGNEPGRLAREFRQLVEQPHSDPWMELEDSVFASVLQTRRVLHIHSERIFLVGVGEGAAVAYCLGLRHPDKFAGVVALNGWLPKGFRALQRFPECRDLRTLILHGLYNDKNPVQDTRKVARMFENAGLSVQLKTYPTTQRISSAMFLDADGWLINQCTFNNGSGDHAP